MSEWTSDPTPRDVALATLAWSACCALGGLAVGLFWWPDVLAGWLP